jgi:hypothetical protein
MRVQVYAYYTTDHFEGVVLVTVARGSISRIRPRLINPLNAELNPIRHLLALVGARHIVHVSRIRVNIFRNTNRNKSTICDTDPCCTASLCFASTISLTQTDVHAINVRFCCATLVSGLKATVER